MWLSDIKDIYEMLKSEEEFLFSSAAHILMLPLYA